MADNKKYYWLKLKEDFFEEDTIQWLEEQENGKDYCLFYLKLCLKSLKTNGILIRNVGQILVPYDVKKLADITNTKPDTVIVAMEVFKKIGLVQVLENGEIYMTQLDNMVGSETNKAAMMRKKREKEKLVQKKGNNVTNVLPSCYPDKEKCYTEIEKEIEKDIDIEKEREIDKKKDALSHSQAIELYKYIEQVTCIPGILNLAAIKLAVSQHGYEHVKRAIDVSIQKSKINMSYINGVLRNWAKEGYPKEVKEVNKDGGTKPSDGSSLEEQGIGL